MSRRNEHVVAIILEPFRIGQEFIDWPLHVTVVPWFPCDNKKKLDELLSTIATGTKKLKIKTGPLAYFGPKKDVPVNLVEENEELTKLHWDIFKTLELNKFPIHQKDFVGKGYRAHITQQKHLKAELGQEFKIDSFALVKQTRQKKTGTMFKAIIKSYELK